MKTIIIDGIEYNLTPKVLFKKGDFVVIQETTYLISKIEGLNVTLSCNGRDCLFDIEVLKNARLWDITKDAKDGDVLVASDGSIFLFKGTIDWGCKHYVALTTDGAVKFNEGLKHFWEASTGVHPATKEQRNQLEKAMADTGYTFDFEKKELKKIEQNLSWSEEDNKIALSIEQIMNCASLLNIVPEKIDRIRTWLKSIKDRVGCEIDFTTKKSGVKMMKEIFKG